MSCARRSERPRPAMNDRTASAPFTSKRLGPVTAAVRPMSWEDRANRDDLSVVINAFCAANQLCEQPRAHGVIEQIRLGEPLRVLDRRRNERTVGYADASNQPSPCRVLSVPDRSTFIGVLLSFAADVSLVP